MSMSQEEAMYYSLTAAQVSCRCLYLMFFYHFFKKNNNHAAGMDLSRRLPEVIISDETGRGGVLPHCIFQTYFLPHLNDVRVQWEI